MNLWAKSAPGAISGPASTPVAGRQLDYTLDSIGQLQTAHGKEPGGTTNRLHEQLRYGHDAAGNFNSRSHDALVQSVNANSFNKRSMLRPLPAALDMRFSLTRSRTSRFELGIQETLLISRLLVIPS